MIYLAIISAGLAKARGAAGEGDAIWCGAAAISPEDFARMDVKPPRFVYTFVGDDAADDLESAIQTIAEHHPGQTIWVEALPAGESRPAGSPVIHAALEQTVADSCSWPGSALKHPETS